jgi:hypothetical protein
MVNGVNVAVDGLCSNRENRLFRLIPFPSCASTRAFCADAGHARAEEDELFS